MDEERPRRVAAQDVQPGMHIWNPYGGHQGHAQVASAARAAGDHVEFDTTDGSRGEVPAWLRAAPELGRRSTRTASASWRRADMDRLTGEIHAGDWRLHHISLPEGPGDFTPVRRDAHQEEEHSAFDVVLDLLGRPGAGPAREGARARRGRQGGRLMTTGVQCQGDPGCRCPAPADTRICAEHKAGELAARLERSGTLAGQLLARVIEPDREAGQ